MGSPAKLSKRTAVNRSLSGGGGGGEGWGMDFLLVFFPQDQSPTLIRRSNSSGILAKAQSTISVCALVIFITLLLFTLSTFEPNNGYNTSSHRYRRHLSQSMKLKTLANANSNNYPNSPALQRLGTLYLRGTKHMNDVVLAHVPESASLTELKSFLRAFHRSGLLSKSDLVFIFPSVTTPESSDDVIRRENQLFLTLIRRYKSQLSNGDNGGNVTVTDFPASFDVSQFVKPKESNRGEAIWGRKVKNGSDSSNSSNDGGGELTRLSYGSVVGFGVGELDPENALSGFLDHVPISLRRWASYPMLLGRLRRSFKHVMLVDAKEVLQLLPLGDPLTRVRTSNPESVTLFLTKLNGRKNKTTDKRPPGSVNPVVIVGGLRGMRRLSAAMLTEIVRATTHKRKTKTKTPATESALLSRLAGSESVQKNMNMIIEIHLVGSAESVPEASSLGGVAIAKNRVVRRGNSNIDTELTKRICSFAIEASIYTECRRYNRSSV
ncbi:hypothetical protein SSX86_015157 [Deinandra increscens subsp. villosa]|uniref:DUF7780 domain-containing protein n=1 Tax=Deinandra increscens subsp. villosa TaxID=3103831 RepID=A0AAP0CZB9_9ASTR